MKRKPESLLFRWLFLLLFLTLCAGCAHRRAACHENPGSWLADVYGRYMSPVDGSRCPSLPSCSSYGRTAFRKHGFFMGWIMTVDRLLHEADEAGVSPVVYFKGKPRVLDPVENTDFWWIDNDRPE